MCVCLSAAILALQATRRPMSDSIGFKTTQALKMNGFSRKYCERYAVKTSKKKPI